jgi:hypothetical protein
MIIATTFQDLRFIVTARVLLGRMSRQPLLCRHFQPQLKQAVAVHKV